MFNLDRPRVKQRKPTLKNDNPAPFSVRDGRVKIFYCWTHGRIRGTDQKWTSMKFGVREDVEKARAGKETVYVLNEVACDECRVDSQKGGELGVDG